MFLPLQIFLVGKGLPQEPDGPPIEKRFRREELDELVRMMLGAIKKEAKLSVQDYNFKLYKEKIEATIGIENLVVLAIDQSSPKRIETSFFANIDVTITSKNAEGFVTKVQKRLSVDYTSLDDTKKEATFL